jgi:hypothetical protein
MTATRHNRGSTYAAGRRRSPPLPSSGLTADSLFGIKRRGVVHSVTARQRSCSAVRTWCALYGIGTSRATALSATGSALANTKASTSRTARSNASSIPSACTGQGRRRQPNQSAEHWPFSAAHKGKLQRPDGCSRTLSADGQRFIELGIENRSRLGIERRHRGDVRQVRLARDLQLVGASANTTRPNQIAVQVAHRGRGRSTIFNEPAQIIRGRTVPCSTCRLMTCSRHERSFTVTASNDSVRPEAVIRRKSCVTQKP